MNRRNNVRDRAYHAMMRVEQEQAGSQSVLFEYADGLPDVRDRALLQKIVLGVLRQRLLLDWLINARVHKPRQLQIEVRQLLRTAVYQLLFLDKIPAFAVVNETVELAKTHVHRGAASLVNAVLRKFKDKRLAPLVGSLDPANESDRAILYSHPQWLLSRWKKDMGPGLGDVIPAVNNQVPPLFVRDLEHDDKLQSGDDPPGFQDSFLPVKGLAGALRVVRPAQLASIESTYPGRFQVQDLHSQWTALQLEPNADTIFLDACCGRGGKLLTTLAAFHSAGKTASFGECWALDSNINRLLQLKERLANPSRFPPRTPIHLCCWDMTRILPDLKGKFSRILLDAPCSNTGVIRRHPEIKWRLSPADITRLAILQKQMIRTAVEYLAPGGHMVYAVCSMEPEEGPQVISSILDHNPDIRVLPLDPPDHEYCCFTRSEQGWLNLYPSASGGDGFFVAKMEKTGK